MRILITALAKQHVITLQGQSEQRQLCRVLDTIDTAADLESVTSTLLGTIRVTKTEEEEVYVMRCGRIRVILAFRPAKVADIILAGVYLAGEDVVERLREAIPITTAVTRMPPPRHR